MTKLSDVRRDPARAVSSCSATISVVLFLLFIYLLLASFRIGSGDGETIYQVTRSLVEERSFAIPPPSPDAVVVDPFGEPIPSGRLRGGGPYGAWGAGGRYYAQYGVGQSVLAVPLYLLGRELHDLTDWGTQGFATRAAVTLLNPLALALTGGALYRLACRLGYRQGVAAGVALAAGLGTPLWVYAKTFFGEPLIALALTVAVLAALLGDEGRVGGWIACGAVLGAAVLIKPVVLVVVLAFLVFVASRREKRWQGLAMVSGPLVVGLVGVAVYNWVRFASPLDTGYRTAAWNVPPWVGLAGLLVSPGKGLLWYCPPVILSLVGLIYLARRSLRQARGRRAVALLSGVSALYLLIHSIYNHWHGAGAWGPRLILPVLPLLILPLVELFQRPPRRAGARLAMAALLAAGVIVQLPAVLVNPARALQALYDRSASPTEYTLRLLYRPTDSPLVGQWRSLLEVSSLMRDSGALAKAVEAARASGRSRPVRWDWLTEAVGILSFNALDLWPVSWRLLGAPLGVLLAIEGMLAVLAVWAAWKLRKEVG